MIRLSQPNNAALEIDAWVRAWFGLIAQGNWGAAFAQLGTRKSAGRSGFWCEKLFREVVEVEIFGPDSLFRKRHPTIVYTDPAVIGPTPKRCTAQQYVNRPRFRRHLQAILFGKVGGGYEQRPTDCDEI